MARRTYHLTGKQFPEEIEPIESLPGEGFAWIDLDRETSPEWAGEVEALTGFKIVHEHVVDSLNDAHPSYFDGTQDYDMVVFRGLTDPDPDRFTETGQITFFLFERLLVTVRRTVARTPGVILKKMRDGTLKTPRRPVGLMHRMLSNMIDAFLVIRKDLTEMIDDCQIRLLDPGDPYNDWMGLLDLKLRLRKLESISEQQEDAIRQWQEGTSLELDSEMTVRFSDLIEHVSRVRNQSEHLQAQIESLVQVHFSATAHRTNEIMKLLTVVAAIFMPLTLVAGVFGMNFENMPELKWRYSYFVLLFLMTGLGVGLLVLFRRRRWI